MGAGVSLLIPRTDRPSTIWRPFYWQRSHTMFLSMMMTLVVLFIVEFSYTNLFSAYTPIFMVRECPLLN